MLPILLESALRATLIAGVIGAGLWIFGVRRPAARHAAWSVMVALMLALPFWTVWGPRLSLKILAPGRPTVNQGVTAPSMERASASPGPGARLNWPLILGAVYALGVSLLAGRSLLGGIRARALRRSARMENGRWTSAACVTPLTLGWLRPVIILPAGWPDWLPQKLEAVLTHEEEHARRRDPLIHSLALLNRAVFWFHPLAWWLEGRLSGLAEEACDAAVIERGHSPGEYADYVMEIARDVTRAGASININGVAMARNSLSQRLRSILEGAPAPRLSRARMLCLVMTCAAASSMFAAGVVEQRSAPLTELPLTTKRFTPETPEEAGNPLERSPESPTPAQVASLSPALQGTQEPGNNPQPRTQVFPVVIDPNEILQVMGVPPGSYNLFMTAPGIPCDTFALRIAPPRPGADLSMPIAPPSHTGDEAMAVVPCQPQEPGTLSQRYLKENPLQFGRSGGGTFQLERLREGGVQIGPLFTEPLAPKDRPRTDPCKYSEPSLRPLSCAYK